MCGVGKCEGTRGIAVNSSHMSFYIVVKPLAELEPEMPEDDSLLDEWLEQIQQTWFYDNPLGGDGTVAEYWCGPAERLGLPLLAQIYQQGLRISNQEKLKQLSRELDTLEAHWHTLSLPEWPPDFKESYLLERMGFFREAIRVALEHKGLLTDDGIKR